MKMRKRISCFSFAFIALMLALPLANVISGIFGWHIRLTYPSAYAVFLSMAALYITFRLFRIRRNLADKDKKILNISAIASMPLIFYNLTQGMDAAIDIVSFTVVLICSICLLIVGGKKSVFNILCDIVSVPFILFVSFLLFVGWIMVDFGSVKVMNEIPSPDGTYRVQIVDINEGALGGSTTVDVMRDTIGFVNTKHFFSLGKRIYIGDWGMWDELDIEWIDNEKISFDGKVYNVKTEGKTIRNK